MKQKTSLMQLYVRCIKFSLLILYMETECNRSLLYKPMKDSTTMLHLWEMCAIITCRQVIKIFIIFGKHCIKVLIWRMYCLKIFIGQRIWMRNVGMKLKEKHYFCEGISIFYWSSILARFL